MKSKNLILNSLKESFLIIKKSKKKIFLLFVLQIFLVSLISYIGLLFLPGVFESTQEIFVYLDQQNFDDTTIGLDILQQKNPLGDDPLLVGRNYDNIVYNLKLFVSYSLLVFIMLNGFIWFLTSNLMNKKNLTVKNFFMYVLKFGFATLIFSLLIYLFLNSTIKSLINPLAETQTNNFILPLLITLALFYFMYLSVSSLNKLEFRNILKNLFRIGVKKGHIILLTYIMIVLVISVFSFLLFYSIEKNLFLLFISMILFISSIIWTRIFFISVVDGLD